MQPTITIQEVDNLKQTVDKGKELLGKAEGRLESLLQQEGDLKVQISQQGIEPENLPAEIERIEKEIQETFAKAKELIPYELINR